MNLVSETDKKIVKHTGGLYTMELSLLFSKRIITTDTTEFKKMFEV
ncbi:hypothetical protein [Apibacter mensalis]|nr:hypothetical protein [Apibacter mensalis]